MASLLYFIVATATDAERGLHATCLAIAVTQKYVEQFRKWPESWNDLQSIADVEVGMYSWPRDAVEVEYRVHIDFDVILAQIACQEPDTFDAIRPIGPAYGSYRGYAYSLIKSAGGPDSSAIGVPQAQEAITGGDGGKRGR